MEYQITMERYKITIKRYHGDEGERIMHGLDRKTHKYLIEPVSETKHIMFVIQKNFMNFTKRIAASKKLAIRVLFETVKYDCQSTTGRNLRRLMVQYELDTIHELGAEATNGKQYATLPEGESWRVDIVKEIVEINQGLLIVTNFTRNELRDILDFAATT